MTGSRGPRPPRRGTPCPVCGRPALWEGNPSRPFCSERCRLIDLGAWVDEAYRIPGRPAAPQSVDGSEDEGEP